MSILCRLIGHVATGTAKWNDGYHFSRCNRCGSDIIRPSQGIWRTPPKNYRVVWKPIGPADIDWGAWQRARRDELPSAEEGAGPNRSTA